MLSYKVHKARQIASSSSFVGLLAMTVLLSTLRGTWLAQARAEIPAHFQIADIKFCKNFNENRQPIEVTSEFPAETENIYAWFSWKNGKSGFPLKARWHYLTEDIHILDFPFALTRTSDTGVLSLRMPPGKSFPLGSYRLELEAEGKVVKSATFTVR